MTGVMALTGITPHCEGNTLIRAQRSPVAAPASMVAGRRTAWFDVPVESRAM
jgi:hypothetical protein